MGFGDSSGRKEEMTSSSGSDTSTGGDVRECFWQKQHL